MMTDLSPQEREAMEEARRTHEETHPSASLEEALDHIWIAAREYSKQREDESGPTRSDMARVIETCAEQRERAERSEQREQKLREALEIVANYNGADWDVEGICGFAEDTLRALAENGDSDE